MLSLKNHRHMTYTTGEKITAAPDTDTSADDFKWLEKTFLYAEGRDILLYFREHTFQEHMFNTESI